MYAVIKVTKFLLGREEKFSEEQPTKCSSVSDYRAVSILIKKTEIKLYDATY